MPSFRFPVSHLWSVTIGHMPSLISSLAYSLHSVLRVSHREPGLGSLTKEPSSKSDLEDKSRVLCYEEPAGLRVGRRGLLLIELRVSLTPCSHPPPGHPGCLSRVPAWCCRFLMLCDKQPQTWWIKTMTFSHQICHVGRTQWGEWDF